MLTALKLWMNWALALRKQHILQSNVNCAVKSSAVPKVTQSRHFNCTNLRIFQQTLHQTAQLLTVQLKLKVKLNVCGGPNRTLRNRFERGSRFSQRSGWEFHPSATRHHSKIQTVEEEGIIFLLNSGNPYPLTQHCTRNNGILSLTYFYETLYEQHVTTDQPHSWTI